MSTDGRIIKATIVGFEKRYDHEHNKVRGTKSSAASQPFLYVH